MPALKTREAPQQERRGDRFGTVDDYLAYRRRETIRRHRQLEEDAAGLRRGLINAIPLGIAAFAAFYFVAQMVRWAVS